MNIEIIDASPSHRDAFSRLMELYQYDFTEYTGEDVGEDGSFGYDHLDACFTEPARRLHLLRIDEHWAGFAIVRTDAECLDGRSGVDMAEVIVLRKYRRHGAGEPLATAMFDRYRGAWQVRELGNNERAQSFWRAVIGRYTGGAYEERAFDTDRRRVVQYFDNGARSR
jgi:predicted acetyltransferase